MKNTNLHKAKKNKNDEFYTQLSDIENEWKHYKHHFKDKVVYCNCDDPKSSAFCGHFIRTFELLGIKKLIVSYYSGMQKDEPATYIEYFGSKTGIPKIQDLKINKLKGNGDFRNEENIELLKDADIIVTNPPFSLFREYVAQLIKYNKKFLIIGNKNAITYKEIFSLIKEGKLWLGITSPKLFELPNGLITKNVSGLCRWFTNLEHKKRNEELILYKKYYGNEKEYPNYDNYNAINVDKVSKIPEDYKGVMGVPVTFLDKFNPNQFEILGQTHSGDTSLEVEALRTNPKRRHGGIVTGQDKEKYARILIKRR